MIKGTMCPIPRVLYHVCCPLDSFHVCCGFVKLPSWPGDNDWEGSRNAGEGGSGGHATRGVKVKMAKPGLR